MNWNQLHHWFGHFPCQFCSITIFTRMPPLASTQPIPRQEFRHIYFNIVVALLLRKYKHQKKRAFFTVHFTAKTLVSSRSVPFLTHFCTVCVPLVSPEYQRTEHFQTQPKQHPRDFASIPRRHLQVLQWQVILTFDSFIQYQKEK